MNKRLEAIKINERILGIDEFVLFRDLQPCSFSAKDNLCAKEIVEEAQLILSAEIPVLRATVYMRYLGDGNRSEYDEIYFQRRSDLRILTMAECIERKGRFIGKIIDMIWAILEETTWIISAHNISKDRTTHANLGDCYDGEHWNIDLFSAETAAELACAYYLLKEDIIKAGGEIALKRIVYEADKRIIKPFLATDQLWWMGFDGGKVNNWNTWITSNILTVNALIVEDIEEKKAVTKKCMACLDNFLAGYKPDGGCDEGPHYWGAAGASLFDCLEILNDMTGGQVNLFDDIDLKNIAEFIYKAHINNSYFITYGDAHAKANVNGVLCRRVGRRFESDIMEGFGQQIIDSSQEHIIKKHHPYRAYKNIVDTTRSDKKYKAPCFIVLEDMQLCAMRETNESDKGFYLWMKGGNNDESHNHNDVGSVGLYLDGEPVMIDIGIGTYTSLTFSDKRYTLFPIRSCDHNLPLIGGCGQAAGAEYKADCFNAWEAEGSVSAELKNAYENREVIDSFIRTASLNNGTAVIHDDIKLKADQDIVFNFYLKNKPCALADGEIDLGCGAVMEYSTYLKSQIEELMLEDEALAADWGCDRIYQLSFYTVGRVRDIKTDFIIKHQY